VTAVLLYLLLIPFGWAVYRITRAFLDRQQRRGGDRGT
jgi:hypothetical protein